MTNVAVREKHWIKDVYPELNSCYQYEPTVPKDWKVANVDNTGYGEDIQI